MLRVVLFAAFLLLVFGGCAGDGDSGDLILRNLNLAVETVEKFPFAFDRPQGVYSHEMADALWAFIKGAEIQNPGKLLLHLARKYEGKLPDFLTRRMSKDDLGVLFIPSLYSMRRSLHEALRAIEKQPPSEQHSNLMALWKLFDSLVSNPRQPSFLLASIAAGMLEDILLWTRTHKIQFKANIPQAGRLLLHLTECESRRKDDCVYMACLLLQSGRVPAWTHQWALSILMKTEVKSEPLRSIRTAVLKDAEKRDSIHQHLLEWAKKPWTPSGDSGR